MEVARLEESISTTWYCRNKTPMFVSLFVGFGVGMLLLSPIQSERHFAVLRPTTNMAIGAPGRSVGNVEPLAVSKLRGVYDMDSYRARYAGSWSLRTPRGVAVHASRESRDAGGRVATALERFQAALEVAQECSVECAMEWVIVEDLKKELAVVVATQEKLALLAKETATVEAVDRNMLNKLKELESASAGIEQGGRVSPESTAALDAALQAARRAAEECVGDECSVAFDTIEKISDVRRDLKT
eukprot:gnl/TRDRNA2_/TRDRNA2_39482_c0_seq2.p1 gnl/TRDRNA2_/TRDRNA2_39482_c0~~gnl/TRDRNA2_/TRDRNA2_39482_c0_seq2.p1  ORF type:complete len:244 (+),score=24.49 gnl/TRDRNA2_/TRDRNA2_39482_c0_seq2:90-821(+)